MLTIDSNSPCETQNCWVWTRLFFRVPRQGPAESILNIFTTINTTRCEYNICHVCLGVILVVGFHNHIFKNYRTRFDEHITHHIYDFQAGHVIVAGNNMIEGSPTRSRPLSKKRYRIKTPKNTIDLRTVPGTQRGDKRVSPTPHTSMYTWGNRCLTCRKVGRRAKRKLSETKRVSKERGKEGDICSNGKPSKKEKQQWYREHWRVL